MAISTGILNAPCGAAKRRFTVADDIKLAHFGDPYGLKAAPVTISPDGRYFVVDTERGLLDKNRPESTLRVFRTEEVRHFLLHPEITHAPSPIWLLAKSTYEDGPIITNIRWLPDSSGVAFLAKTSSGNDQLFLADLMARTLHALTPQNQDVTAFDIRGRDGFVYSVRSPRIRERAVAESRATSVVGTGREFDHLLFPADFQSMSWIWDLSELWAVVGDRRFRVKDKTSGRPLSVYSAGQRTLALSPDGLSVVIALAVRSVPLEWETRYGPSLPSDPYRIRAGHQDLEAFNGQEYVSEYFLLDLVTFNVKSLTNAPIGERVGWWSGVLSANWSSDGQSIALSNTFLPLSMQRLPNQSARPCISVVELANGRLTCLETIKGKTETKNGYEDGFHYVQSVSFARGSSTRVIVDYYAPDGSKGSTSYRRSEDGLWAAAAATATWPDQDSAIDVVVEESLNVPPVLVATDTKSKTSRVIFDPNPQLKDIDLGEASVYKWKDKNGREWVGGLYRPSDYVPGQRYPLVVQTHGFSEKVFRPSGIYPTAFAARELAATGFVVLQAPNCPVTVNPEEGPCNVAGYEAGVERLIADGVVDPDRIGIVGFSRTCYYVMLTLTTSTLRFKAASITDGFSLGYLQYLTNVDMRNNAIAHEADAMVGAAPFGKGLQQWINRSPQFNMDKVMTPLQVVALGRSDLAFMWEQYATLRYLNKPVDLVVLAKGTHILTNPAELMISQGGTVDWFRFWLKGEEDYDPTKAEQYTRWRDLRKLQ